MTRVDKEQITWKRDDEEETIVVEATITATYKEGDKGVVKDLRREMNFMLSRLNRGLLSAKHRDNTKDTIQVHSEVTPGGITSNTTMGEAVPDFSWTTKAKESAKNNGG